MKHLVIVLSLLIIGSASSSLAAADNWEEYLEFKSKYYHLDEQQFNSIKCNVESPALTNLIGQIKEELVPFKENVEIVDNLSIFSVSYSNSAGLGVTRPELDVVIKSEEGIANPDRFRNGVLMIESGFEQSINGVVMQLEGILEAYDSPRREDFDMLEVTNTDNGLTATYKRKGNHITETFSDNKLITTSSGMDGEIHVLDNYDRTDDDKLILKESHITAERSVIGKVVSDISVTYQKVGPVTFPKSIVSKFTQEIQTLRQEGHSEINLSNCVAD